MSCEVPVGWEIKSLKSMLNLTTGFPFKSNQFNDDAETGTPVVRIRDLTEQSPSIFTAEPFDMRYLVRRGDYLIGMDGEFSAIKWEGLDAALNQRVLKLSSSSSELDSEFLYYRIQPELTMIQVRTGATTVKHLSTKDLLSLEISLPPLYEQRRIAEILSSVDDAIAATQAVIEQTKKVKQATLERLLTKGIGHTRFKQTTVGEIPEMWEAASLEQLLANIPAPMRSGPFGSALKSEELVQVGIPFLGIDNIHVERFVPSFRRFISKDKFQQLRRFAVNPKDVVITIMGTVGRCCVIPLDIGAAISSKHIWAMSFDNDKYIPELACWQLNYAPWVTDKFRMSAQGGIMSAINSDILKKLLFPVPCLSEQQQIFEVWQSFQTKIHVEEAKLESLVKLKSALMSDLLTGRKRVTDTLPLAAE